MSRAEIYRQTPEIPSQELIAKQATLFQGVLADLGLSNKLEISTHPVRRRVRKRNRGDNVVVGYIGPFINDSAFAAFVSSAPGKEVSRAVTPILVTATDTHSGLRADDRTGTIYADSFWEVIEGKLTHITPNEPVLLDGVFMAYDGENVDPTVLSQLSRSTLQFLGTSKDKYDTKDNLSQLNVTVPPSRLSGDIEVVRKPAKGAYGDRVRMGKMSSKDMQNSRDLFTHGENTILEERIIPPPKQILADLYNAYRRGKNRNHKDLRASQIDYNFRVITTLGLEPKILTAEVRFGKKSSNPISVTKGALAIPVDLLGDPEMVKDVLATAQDAVFAQFDLSRNTNEPEAMPLYVGIDIIPDRKRNDIPTVLEIQPFPGGFGTLTKFAGEYLPTIADVFVPWQHRALQHRIATRSTPVGPLRKVPIFDIKIDNEYLSESRMLKDRKKQKVVI